MTQNGLLGRIRRLAPGVGSLLSDRLFRSVLELAAGLWMARYLGPGSYGDLSFALATVALAGPVAALGLQGVLVRELVAHPEDTREILGTATGLRLAASTLLVGCMLAGFPFLVDGTRLRLVQIIAFTVVLQVSEVLDLYLQARSRMRASAVARSGAAAVASATRVLLILSAAGVASFAWTFVGELSLWGVLLTLAYRIEPGTTLRLRWSTPHASRLLRRSWPLILSGIGAVLNLKIDQVMLAAMSTPHQLGVYAAAARLSEAAYFLPFVVVAAAFPGIIRARESDMEDYHARLRRLTRWMVILAWGVIIGGLLLGPSAIRLILGRGFLDSVRIFQIHVFACLFIFPGVVLSRWLISEDLTKFSMTRHASGGVVNILLNLLLIPAFGGVGAAIATVASYATASHLSFYVSRRTRPAATMVTRTLFFAHQRREGNES
jgi:PST family polysaccharide transporter